MNEKLHEVIKKNSVSVAIIVTWSIIIIIINYFCYKKMAGDYQYDFVDPLPEECPCPVCLEVQVDPHQVTCCGKIFCKSCLDKLVGRKQNCPICREDFVQGKRYFRDLNTERKINQLHISCENNKKGCKWVGRLKDMEELHFPKCPNHPVPCRNIKGKKKQTECGALVQRQELHEHMTLLCVWRQVECVYCNFKGSHNFITGDHTKVCKDYLVPCINKGCEIKMNQTVISQHQTSCPKQVVPCRYSSVGCKAKITRENVVSHNHECMEQHLDSAVDKVEKISDTLDQTRRKLDDKLNESQAKLKQTCNTLGQTRNKLDQTRDTLDKVLKRIDSLEGKLLAQEEKLNEVEEEIYNEDEDDYDENEYGEDDYCYDCGDYHHEYEPCDYYS